jgi:hypothetical protein
MINTMHNKCLYSHAHNNNNNLHNNLHIAKHILIARMICTIECLLLNINNNKDSITKKLGFIKNQFKN